MLIVNPTTLKNEGLTQGMISALESAYCMQKSGKPISLKEINGSRTALINRDLLEFSTIFINRKAVDTWRLTKKALGLIRFLHLESKEVMSA